ncbi:hypothetical protein ASG29_08670 [Sphingomonas sp. Leaf412]|uniref:hypothetical protein n=1 Tax=Sphingomonas sp. Leaf412 TaxID=1736370 RepID=UPI0006F3B0D5|nr:hypothetical protein [Sphingomonas sp. Leaf412]KQT31936.1 hypothetical protein ASG29_08670 [Sphingomonas sp. Leaf412]
MTNAPRWVPLWFRIATIYGVVALTGAAFGAPAGAAALPHYAFVGTALAFHALFWIIAGDPVRYRPVMLAAVAEKAAFTIPALLLVARGTVPASTALFAAIDAVLGIGFLLAWRATPRRAG